MTPHLQLVSLHRLWDHGSHNAFPDLQWWQGSLYCALREGEAHESGQDGAVVLLKRENPQNWTLVDRVTHPQSDLRDPKLSVAPDGSLYLLAGAAKRDASGKYLRFDSLVRHMRPNHKWDDWHTVGDKGWWLWRVSWDKEGAYGIAYCITDPTQRTTPWKASLWHTTEGLVYETVCSLDVGAYPSEGTVLRTSDNRLVAVIRRGLQAEEHAYVGHSQAPYCQWKWSRLTRHIGAPDLLLDSSQHLRIAGRIFEEDAPRTFVGRIVNKQLHVDLVLPSGGDNSYPSLALDEEGRLLCAYYSSHEETTAVYLATLEIL